MTGLWIWIAGIVTGGAGGLALGYVIGRGHRRLPPIEFGRRG